MVVCSPVPALRAGLSALIDGDPDCTVWAAVAAPDGLPGPLPADCVIVADAGGLEALSMEGSALVARGAALLLVSGDLESTAAPLDGLRAWGAITPEASAGALRSAVRALAEGLNVYSPELLPEPPAAARPALSAGRVDDLGEALTERESQVLLRLAEGLTNKQAALALGISEHTVKFHVSSIYSKLGVTNRAEAVREGARRGLVPL